MVRNVLSFADSFIQGYTITSNNSELWITGRVIKGRMIIEQNAILDIENTTIHFADTASGILIREGGYLKVSHSTLTGICNSSWKGVELNALSLPTSVLVTDRSVIENALIGINYIAQTAQFIPALVCTTIGGFKVCPASEIRVENSIFRQNQIGIKAQGLPDPNGRGLLRVGITVLGHSIFEGKDSMPRFINNPVTFIEGVQSDVVIDSSIFVSNITDEDKRPTAVIAISNTTPWGNTLFDRVGFSAEKNHFINLKKAIEINNMNPAYSAHFSFIQENDFSNVHEGIMIFQSYNLYGKPVRNVSENRFTNVARGIYAQGTLNDHIHKNTFSMPLPKPNSLFDNFGIFMAGCDAFLIQGNNLVGSTGGHGGSGPLLAETYGIVVENSNQNLGVIFNNTFSNMDYHLQTQFDNSQLKIRCNNFNDPATIGWITFDDLRQQGANCNLNNGNTNQAGNEWTFGGIGCTGGTPSDIYYNDNSFAYFAHDQNTSGAQFVTDPENCTNLEVNTNPIIITDELNTCTGVNKTPQSCDKSTDGYLPPPPPDGDCSSYMIVLNQLIEKYNVEIIGSKAQLKKFDGGKTKFLLQLINKK